MIMAEANGTATCPVCGKLVRLEAMNNHIDICLLPGGKELHNEQPLARSSDNQTTSQTDGPLATNPSQPHFVPASSLQLQPAQSTLLRKRSSPSTSPSGSSNPKQSFLSFGQQTPQSHFSTSAKPPPAKARKLAVVTNQSSTNDTEDTALSSRGVKGKPKLNSELSAPLAEMMRPSTIDDYVGQESVIGKNAILHTILESGNVPSLIFWGPPGCGKTTLARIIAKVAHQKASTKFVQLSATTAGVKDIKEIVQVARNEKIMFKRNTILFIDEIHRFNKLQQDTFLPHVEDGTITLLGATTENPSFQLNSALLSRCRVIVLEKLQSEEIEQLLRRALGKLGVLMKGDKESEMTDCHSRTSTVFVEPDALTTLSQLCDGDARSALNGLELAVQAKRTKLHVSEHKPPQRANQMDASTCSSLESRQSTHTEVQRHSSNKQETSTTPDQLQLPEGSSNLHVSPATVTVQDVMDSLQRTHLLYDRAGEEHYNIISALHKSMRGSDANASLYWLARMLCAGEDPLYVARRVVRFASEDIGLADPNALSQAVAAFQACQQIGMPECQVVLAQAVVYMARAPKSVEVYMAYENARQCILNHKGPLPSVPLHLRNAPTKLMKSLGYGKGYKYNPGFREPVEQQYMPNGLEGINFFTFEEHYC